MKHALACLLAISLMAASTGCHSLGRRSPAMVPADAAYDTPAGCEDGSCDGVQSADAACADGSCAIGGTGYCGPGCGIAAKMARHSQKRCDGLHGGLAKGPNMGAVVYPYYTIRGPRDFLRDDPPSIGR